MLLGASRCSNHPIRPKWPEIDGLLGGSSHLTCCLSSGISEQGQRGLKARPACSAHFLPWGVHCLLWQPLLSNARANIHLLVPPLPAHRPQGPHLASNITFKSATQYPWCLSHWAALQQRAENDAICRNFSTSHLYLKVACSPKKKFSKPIMQTKGECIWCVKTYK